MVGARDAYTSKEVGILAYNSPGHISAHLWASGEGILVSVTVGMIVGIIVGMIVGIGHKVGISYQRVEKWA